MTTSYSVCAVCGANDWLELPPPHSTRSVRSDGAVIGHPMCKAQCNTCGLVQSTSLSDAAALTALYTDDYDIYNNRPSSEQFVSGRYTALAEAITGAVSPGTPQRVLEVGGGNGSTLKAVQSLWPDAFCIGMEPVKSAVKAAQAEGINFHQGMIGGVLPRAVAEGKYDVIYSVHVIEHTENPVSFLKGLKALLAPHGKLVITCPDARTPNLEMMRSDHQYSMTPYHLSALVRKAGLRVFKSTQCPGGAENLDYDHNQLAVCYPVAGGEQQPMLAMPDYLKEAERRRLFEARRKYANNFADLDDKLQARMKGYERIACFGTGGWAAILAGFAPGAWKQVQACVIDGGSDHTFSEKPILAYDKLNEMKPDLVIIGINPATQPRIALRLQKDGYSAICWNDLIAM